MEEKKQACGGRRLDLEFGIPKSRDTEIAKGMKEWKNERMKE